MTKIDQNINWKHIAAISAILAIGARRMKVKRMSKMLLQNSVFMGVILLLIMVLIKIRNQDKQKKIAHIELDVEKIE